MDLIPVDGLLIAGESLLFFGGAFTGGAAGSAVGFIMTGLSEVWEFTPDAHRQAPKHRPRSQAQVVADSVAGLLGFLWAQYIVNPHLAVRFFHAREYLLAIAFASTVGFVIIGRIAKWFADRYGE